MSRHGKEKKPKLRVRKPRKRVGVVAVVLLLSGWLRGASLTGVDVPRSPPLIAFLVPSPSAWGFSVLHCAVQSSLCVFSSR